MVKKIDLKQNVKVKQKQNVNVRVNIDQRNTKKKPGKKRSNIPSAKREGVSSFSTGFTPVYIQSGNPYPIPPIPPVPDATPIRVPIQQREVSSLVNPPITSTTNLIQEVRTTPKKKQSLKIHSIDSRSISPLSFEDLGSVSSYKNTPSVYESVGGRKYYAEGRGILNHYTPSVNDNSGLFSRDVRPITIRQPRRTRKEMNEAEKMGDNDTLNSKKGKK